ncbi:receptor-like protein kinase FERONIA [Malus sylvestris]|uniref:receptor-like protein kinase FERONIA n=1 Tax=Malus sylvestris TaxID=3752 RepID=UPI0021AC2272|nr:receptor-like protein kinase FERONIA [Malus sylvestris]
MLQRYVSNPSHVIHPQPLEINPDLTCDEVPVTILDWKDKVLRNKTVRMVKVLRRNHSVEEATWEKEEHMQDIGAKGSIIHRDVKSTNILLDEKMVAKVLDFGLSKMGMASTSKTHISTVVKVLWEVLCARPALMQKVEATQINLTELANSCHGDGTFDQIIDPNVKGKIEVECLNKFVDIAISCLHDKGIERPSMNDVVRGLELALQLHQKGIGSKGDNGFAYGNDNGDDEYSEQCIFVTIFSEINDTDGK